MRLLIAALLGTLSACATATTSGSSASRDGTAPPAMDAITEADLRRDLDFLASDAMRGREAGTLDELRASVWLAERAREAGLEPAGDDGTYFQFFPLRRVRTSERSTVTLGDRPLAFGRDFVVWSPVTTTVDLPLVWLSDTRPEALANVDVRGKAVAAELRPPNNPPRADVSLRGYRYALSAVQQQANALVQRGAAAVVLVSDTVADQPMAFTFAGVGRSRGSYGLDTGQVMPAQGGAPVLWIRRSLLDAARGGGTGGRLRASIIADVYTYPSVNVVARVPGTDAARRGEYVLFSGHQDHDGVRYPIDGDSIWNGADDNATVSVAMLAIGRAVARRPMPRSALFVWHGAEERGLLGSRWYAMRPTVPRGSIAAVLNADMIGRNHPDSAALLGVQPPHLNSRALANAALEANARWIRFALDTIWDRPTHPEGWYFRSDHLPYARAGVPAIMFSTLLHPDYHTPRDESARISAAKLARVTRWMYATGWLVGTAPQRPDVVPGFRLER